MSFTRADVPDLTGRVAVITGANSGLGRETAKALAAKGAQVVMAVRNQESGEEAAAQVRRESPGAEPELVQLDLGSLASVADASRTILDRYDRIDLLVNNAGVMATPEQATVDGFELQLGTNHLGHWALAAQLMPALLAAPAARVVSVTSTAHHFGRALDPANPHLHGRYTPWVAYSQSKLANYHFALGLHREFRRAGVAAASLLAHPGLSDTGLQADAVASGGGGPIGQFFHWLVKLTGMSPAQGAMPQIRAATDPSARSGEFYGPRFVNNGPAVRLPLFRPGGDAAIRSLWQVSERETGIKLIVA
jgi:NAD(P)-dependent dehydrogenase (short-subunit alcohol dehydrogenase family)